MDPVRGRELDLIDRRPTLVRPGLGSVITPTRLARRARSLRPSSSVDTGVGDYPA
jgi:hypothetical protein